jgi:hypothetical protein
MRKNKEKKEEKERKKKEARDRSWGGVRIKKFEFTT